MNSEGDSNVITEASKSKACTSPSTTKNASPRAVSIAIPDKDNNEGKFKFDEEALKEIIQKNNVEDLPISIISIAGAFRKGKSFLLNLFLRYLAAENKDSWLDSENPTLSGFSWKVGSKRDTLGILVWDKIFRVKTSNGSEVALLLMDTQGAFDGDSSVKEYAAIFAISTLLSSVQIYNLSQLIQEDDFQHLELFLEYGKLATQKSNCRPFQSLMFLIRDWSYPWEHEYGSEGGEKFLENNVFSEKKHPQFAKVRDHIHSFFEEMRCYLMPHPGLTVACSADFKGGIQDINSDFQQHICELVKLILSPQNLKIKKINGEVITCKEFITYFQSYTKLYNGDDLPNATTVLEATVQASSMSTVNRCVQLYNEKMDTFCDRHDSYVGPTAFEELHAEFLNDALSYYDSSKKLGQEDSVSSYRTELEEKINTKYEEYKTKNEARKALCNTRTPIVLATALVVTYILSALFNMLWLYPISNIFTYCCLFSLLGILTWCWVQFTGGHSYVGEVLDNVTKSIWEDILLCICQQVFTKINFLPTRAEVPLP